ncbi:hypothetical protein CP532_4008 [Ophiocordyceps camponoti-leonardi (nom. inval.)]|nr:hypothetical protein CP532_4008 [Ophiocordyceps camponoti-leonardi (nom. inval.)]
MLPLHRLFFFIFFIVEFEFEFKRERGRGGERFGFDIEGSSGADEFENLLVARNVIPRLNRLEAILSEASSRRKQSEKSKTKSTPTPPHLLPPKTILAAHHASALTAHQSVLNAKLQTSQALNARLARVIRRQRADRVRLLARIRDAGRDLVAANDALAPVVDHLAAEAREAASQTSA